MKKYILSIIFSLFFCNLSYALEFDFSGTFADDDDIVLMNFTVGMDSNITIFSSSWGNGIGPAGYVEGGGFDPILAIWDSNGDLVAEQDDGGVVGSTLSNGVSYTYGVWDSFFSTFIVAGSYTASIGQYNNFVNGTNLSSGFVHDGDPTFTQAFSSNPQTYFNGVWDDSDYRTGDWEFHILNVAEASQPVPEPSTILLLSSGLLGIAFRKKRFLNNL